MDNQNFDQQTPRVEPKAQNASPLNKGLIIGLSAGIVVLLATVIYLLTAKQAVSPVVDNNQLTENQEQAEDNSQSLIADWQIYKNSEYGFELTFSDAWKGYQVFASEGTQGVGHPTYLQFSMPTSDKTKCVQSVTDNVCGYAQIFEITIFDKDIWGQMSADQKRFGQVLGESSESVYIYGIRPVELPSDLENTNFDVPKIISTFKFTNQNETAEWKTYRNEEYGFEFRTDESVKLAELTSVQKDNGLLLNLWVGSRQISVYNYSLFYSDNVNKSQVDQLNSLIKDYDGFKENRSLTDQGSQEPGSGVFYLNILKKRIDGIPALDIRTNSAGGSDRQVIMRKDNYIYTFYNPKAYFRYNSETGKQELIDANVLDPVFEKILSTYKFIN